MFDITNSIYREAKNSPVSYNKSYYERNRQNEDRIALGFYYRLAKSFVKSGKVLDYGCGTGHLIKRFGKGYETWAYDISEYALQCVKMLAPRANTCTGLDSLKEIRFDLIISLHVLEHIEKPFETLLFFNEILSKKGALIYAVPNLSGIGQKMKKTEWSGYNDPTHVSLFPAEKWLSLTKSAGFKILKVGTDGLWDVPYLPLVPKFIQKLIFYSAPAMQVISGRLILPVSCGESLIIVAQKV